MSVLPYNGMHAYWTCCGSAVWSHDDERGKKCLAKGTSYNRSVPNPLTEFRCECHGVADCPSSPTNIPPEDYTAVVDDRYPRGDVRRYGAKPDGVTDNTAALQAALNIGGVPLPAHEHMLRGMPTDDKARKAIPIFDGLLGYFPDACLAVARVSKAGNDQHNPGEPLHWARGKSMDQMNTALRHMMDHGCFKNPKDTDGSYHLAKAAWRILAQLQLTIEAESQEKQ